MFLKKNSFKKLSRFFILSLNYLPLRKLKVERKRTNRNVWNASHCSLSYTYQDSSKYTNMPQFEVTVFMNSLRTNLETSQMENATRGAWTSNNTYIYISLNCSRLVMYCYLIKI